MAKINIDGHNYHMQGPDECCFYNNGVLCGLHSTPSGSKHCESCGWTRAVNAVRLEKVRNEYGEKKKAQAPASKTG